MTLRARLLAAALILLLSLGVSGYLIVRTLERSELRQIDNQLNASQPIAVGIARNTQVPSSGLGSLPQPSSTNNALSDIYVATISDGERSTIVAPESAKGKQPRTPSTGSSSLSSAKPETVGSSNGTGRWRAVLLETPTGGQVLVAVYMGAVDASTRELRTSVLAAGGVVAVILLACAFWIERLGLRPIAEMRRVAEAIVAGDRDRRVRPTSARAETADLASALNSMLDQQKTIESRLRQFVADASHELRTPTAAISGLTQLWRQGDLRHGTDLQDAMRRIGQESARMKALVEELLLLAVPGRRQAPALRPGESQQPRPRRD